MHDIIVSNHIGFNQVIASLASAAVEQSMRSAAAQGGE
jgi:hypothetical protein